MIYKTDPIVAMDNNHINFIYSLMVCAKPKKVLEIGVGSGLVTNALLKGFEYNNLEVDLTCVDNFYDWNGVAPEGFDTFSDRIRFINSSERDFTHEHKETYDFIVSDADHHHANEWIDLTVGLLNPGGALICHDVTNPQFRNLYGIVSYAESKNLTHIIFNKSSLPHERCERGLIVIFKK